MESIILQTFNLTEKFGDFTALDNVNITIREKHVYGFIGENGSGKTTLMRILTGLIFPTSGSYTLFGEEDIKKQQKMRKFIGSTIEAPVLYNEYSAYQNLELQRVLLGNPDKEICDEILKLVDLYDVKSKKVKKFSMGMKQRLSIALALIGRPKMLILDEPVNGLDPKNIANLRKILKKLNEEENMTLFISSHILNELYMLATDYIIIDKGKIIESLTHKELETKCQKYICIKTDNLELCLTVIDRELNSSNYKVIDDMTVHLFDFVDNIVCVSDALMKNKVVIRELSLSEKSLEEYFLEKTGGVTND